MTDLTLTNLTLKEKLDNAAKVWGKPADYRMINPELIAKDLKDIFKGVDPDVARAAINEKIREIAPTSNDGRPRFAMRVRAAAQSLGL